jgi:3-dehydroquinate dehydratase
MQIRYLETIKQISDEEGMRIKFIQPAVEHKLIKTMDKSPQKTKTKSKR